VRQHGSIRFDSIRFRVRRTRRMDPRRGGVIRTTGEALRAVPHAEAASRRLARLHSVLGTARSPPAAHTSRSCRSQSVRRPNRPRPVRSRVLSAVSTAERAPLRPRPGDRGVARRAPSCIGGRADLRTRPGARRTRSAALDQSGCGTALLQPCVVAALRSCSSALMQNYAVAGLRCCSTALLQHCVVAALRCCRTAPRPRTDLATRRGAAPRRDGGAAPPWRPAGCRSCGILLLRSILHRASCDRG
jgi:ribosomal protein L40E